MSKTFASVESRPPSTDPERPAPSSGLTRGKLTLAQIASFAEAAAAQFIRSIGGPPPTSPSATQQASAEVGVTYRLTNPGASPEAQHAAWCREKKRLGWKQDAIRSEEKKTHPNLIPFNQLSLVKQARLKVFIGVVDALKGLLGAKDDPYLEPDED